LRVLLFYYFTALFEAVEQQDIDLAKQILETDAIFINR